MEITRLLLESSAQLDVADKRGFRPLHYACQHGRAEIASLLISRGANCVQPTTYTQDTPLHLAVQHATASANASSGSNATSTSNSEAEAIALLLLSSGDGHFSLGIANKTQRLTPFELACEQGKTRMVRLILKYCADNRMKTGLGKSKFSDSRSAGSSPRSTNGAECASLLAFLAQYSGSSLHAASKNGHNDIVRLLLAYEVADVNSEGSSEPSQGTALHEACRHGRLQTVKLLLECGCEAEALNQLGQTPAEVVIKQKTVANDIRCLLREYGQAVRVLSTQPYLNCHSGALNFSANELIVVLERPDNSAVNGSASAASNHNEIYSSLGASIYGTGEVTCLWRGFILDRRNLTTRSGYFPSSYVRALTDDELATLGRPGPQNVVAPLPNNANCAPVLTSVVNEASTVSGSSGGDNVLELIGQGLTESQIIFGWLSECGLESYYAHFAHAGYDLLTLLQATPADLAAIGIRSPAHRHLLKQHMCRLDIADLELQFTRLLASCQSIEQLLRLVHLEQYQEAMRDQHHFRSLADLANLLTWEDLEEIGVHRLGHQKKLMLVARRLKLLQSQQHQQQNGESSEKRQATNSRLSHNSQLTDSESLSAASAPSSKSASPRKPDSRPVPPKRINSASSTSTSTSANSLHGNPQQRPLLPPRTSSRISDGDAIYGSLPSSVLASPSKPRGQARPALSSHCRLASTGSSSPPGSVSCPVSSSGTVSPSSTSSSSASNNGYFESSSDVNGHFNDHRAQQVPPPLASKPNPNEAAPSPMNHPNGIKIQNRPTTLGHRLNGNEASKNFQ